MSNKIYRHKFNRQIGELIAVNQISHGISKTTNTKSSGKSAMRPLSALLSALSLGLFAVASQAANLPVSGQIIAGQGSISASGNNMVIRQNTQRLATNWQSFDIGQNHSVQFIQPDSSAVALNRVIGASASQIMGKLNANGRVFLINPNGVIFGKNAKVNTAGLVASTRNISVENFINGDYRFSDVGGNGQIINQGNLQTTANGFIVLAGDQVKNQGVISTPGGKTALLAAKQVTLQLDNSGLTQVKVNGSIVNALVENHGLISATNGQVFLTAKGKDMLLKTVVNNSGIIEAKGLNTQGGAIRLDGGASGVVQNSGALLASSDQGRGGSVRVEGENIHLTHSSRISATGGSGGGEVLIGGGWQGKDASVRNASKLVMDQGALIDVSATRQGNGGTAVLWSNDYTNFQGTINAKGGAQGGNGGQVETSSHDNLQAFGDVNISAPNGKGGEWLLDPTDVTIVSGKNHSKVNQSHGTFQPANTGAQVSAEKIVAQLNQGGQVTVKTSGHNTQGQKGNITVNTPINKTKGGDATLTLLADNNIIIADNTKISRGFITSTSGKLNLTLLAGNSHDNSQIRLGKFFSARLNGGSFYAGPANKNHKVSLFTVNNGLIQAKDITLYTYGGLTSNYFNWQATGNIKVFTGDFNLRADGWNARSEFNAKGGLEVNAYGNVNLTAKTNNGSGKIVLSGDRGVSIIAMGKAFNITGTGNNSDVSINSKNGRVALNADKASIIAKKLNISAKDISIYAKTSSTNSAIQLDNANLTAQQGIRIEGDNLSQTSGAGITLNNTNLTANNGNIYLSGVTRANGAGITFNNTTTSAIKGNITAYGDGNGKVSGFAWQRNVKEGDGAINILGRVQFSAKNTHLHGENHVPNVGDGALSGVAGLTLANRSNLIFNGNGTINATSNGSGILFRGEYFREGQYVQDAKATLTVNNGTLNVNAKTTSTADSRYSEDAAVTFKQWYNQKSTAHFVVNNGNINIIADASNSKLDGFAAKSSDEIYQDRGAFKNFVFSGVGNISIHGKAQFGNGISLRGIDNTGLKGKTILNGESKQGKGVQFKYTNANLVNTDIIGRSISDYGVFISTRDNFNYGKQFKLINGTISGFGNILKKEGNNIVF